MKREEIHFVIDREGNIQSTIQGVKGSACRNIAQAIEKLGQVRKKAFSWPVPHFSASERVLQDSVS